MKITVGALVCLLSANVMAADRAATLKALMDAQGLVATFEQQRAAGKEYSKKQADAMLEFTKKLQADYAGTVETATKHFIDAAQAIVKDCNCKK